MIGVCGFAVCGIALVGFAETRYNASDLRVALQPVPDLEEVLGKDIFRDWRSVDADAFANGDQVRRRVQTYLDGQKSSDQTDTRSTHRLSSPDAPHEG